jgi:tellurium resistance protein TerZ
MRRVSPDTRRVRAPEKAEPASSINVEPCTVPAISCQEVHIINRLIALGRDERFMESIVKPEGSVVSSSSEEGLDEIVFGLHWDSPQGKHGADPVDLDAICVLFDERFTTLQVIHAAHPRSEDDSVIHTGDSSTGAGSWDDERIFVFLEMLPLQVSGLVFFVARAADQALHELRGAFCHISDRISEKVWAKFDLPSLSERSIHAVATVTRRENGWEITEGLQFVNRNMHLELSSLRSSLLHLRPPPG